MKKVYCTPTTEASVVVSSASVLLGSIINGNEKVANVGQQIGEDLDFSNSSFNHEWTE